MILAGADRRSIMGASMRILSLIVGLIALCAAGSSQGAEPARIAFPGAQGAAAATPGGRGGQILRVTTLAADGPGSLADALATPGPRIVVFEVGGVIDLGRRELRITEPFVTVAGQTAPSPGITLIKGGLVIATHDVIVRHLRVRPGTAGLERGAGVDFDAITTIAARDVIVDQCSLTWATDENLSASGPRFAGDGPSAWREATSHRITFSRNLIAEGLGHATHAKGEHSKGSLIHDHADEILIIGNLYAHNRERNPLFKGGVRGVVVNNLVYDPGAKAMHYNLIAEEWKGHAPEVGRMVVIGNVLRGGPSTPPTTALLAVGGSGGLQVWLEDNIAVDRTGAPLRELARYTTAPVRIERLRQRPPLPQGVIPLPATAVQDAVIATVGARPWDRDAHDVRILANVIEDRGGLIDHEDEVGGYPVQAPTTAPFDSAAWDLDTMERRAP
jgi:hypothetical protein